MDDAGMVRVCKHMHVVCEYSCSRLACIYVLMWLVCIDVFLCTQYIVHNVITCLTRISSLGGQLCCRRTWRRRLLLDKDHISCECLSESAGVTGQETVGRHRRQLANTELIAYYPRHLACIARPFLLRRYFVLVAFFQQVATLILCSNSLTHTTELTPPPPRSRRCPHRIPPLIPVTLPSSLPPCTTAAQRQQHAINSLIFDFVAFLEYFPRAMPGAIRGRRWLMAACLSLMDGIGA